QTDNQFLDNLKTVAGSYHTLGLSIIPFKLIKKGEEHEKIILAPSWRQWENQLQTDEEFLNLNWKDANAFAVICGTKTNNGLYLSVVDYDCKGVAVSEDVKEKGRVLLKEFPITAMEQTVNNGTHLLYLSRTKPKTIGTYHDTASLELLGEKKLCLMTPSYGYTKLNDNTPTEIENIEQTFLLVMKKHGFLKEPTYQTPNQQNPNKTSIFNEPRPCIIEALKKQLTGTNGHRMRIAIAAEYKRLGYAHKQIIELFHNQPDYDINTCNSQIESIDSEKTAKCESIKEYGYCLSPCPIGITEDKKRERYTKNKEENKPVLSAGFATKECIFEQAFDERNGNYYIVWDRKEQKIIEPDEPCYSYNIKGINYTPIEQLAWPTVTMYSDYECVEELYTDIRSFIVEHLDVPNEFYYDVYTCFILATWRTEDFTTVPYIFFIGPMASGKTRGLECFNYLCYRSIMAASISAASLFRALEAWHPTLLLDETEIYNTKDMVEVISLLNSGYKKGQRALRVKGMEQGNPQIAAFDVFGFKTLAGTQELAETLQSRCIVTAMSKATRQVNIFVDEVKAQSLRNKLLTYRFRTLGTADSNMIPLFLQENPSFRNGRVIELFVSLLQVAPTIEVKQKLCELMKQITQSRLNAEQAGVDAQIFEALLKSEGKVSGGKISTQEITDTFNEGRSEKEQSKSRFIGHRIVALGFEKCRVGVQGRSGFFYDIKIINRLKARYFPDGLQSTLESSETSVSVEKQGLMGYCTEVTEVNTEVNSNEKTTKTNILPYKTEVTEVTEQTEGKKEKGTQVYSKVEFNGYEQIVCVFCGKDAADDHVRDEFTWNKYAHKACYDEKRSQLKQKMVEGYQQGADDEDLVLAKEFEPIDHEMLDFEDKCEPPEGEF
ncbi:MAG: hypothetical protein FWD52_09695, partial [Candidatus Bathyarchaeota archaeon]|nr:hypothetical protein [Candidatus Termiticorpusculum sp.]